MKTSTWALNVVAVACLMAAGVAFSASDSSSLMNTTPTAQGTPSLKPYFPDQTTAPSVTSGGAYFGNLPNCPGDASPPAGTAVPSPVPICPDINNVWPGIYSNTPQVAAGTTTANLPAGALNKYCPDACQTHRAVTTKSYVVSGATYTYVTSMTEAACPTGYVQIGATNPDYAIQYNPSNVPTTPHTVTDPLDYIKWVSSGANCVVSQIFNWNYCDWSSNLTKSSNTNSCVASSTVSLSNPAGVVSYFTNRSTNTLTFGQTIKCDATGTKYSQGSACTIPYAVSTNSTKFVNMAGVILCYIPEGYYYTSDKIPTTLICARVKSVWNKKN